MKKTLFIYFLLLSSFSFGQNLKKKIGDIEIQLIGHFYKRNSDYVLTKRKTNNAKRPSVKLFFDSKGNLLKKIKFGTNHNSSLKLIGEIELYNYSNSYQTSSLQYYSDCYCEKNIEPYFKSKFAYNKSGELIEESTYYQANDSLFSRITYDYDLDSNNTKTVFSPTHYYKREFDSLNRITSLKQIYDNKTRWEWNYTYPNNKRIGIFQTYYNDGKDYSKKEIQTYNNLNLLVETEEVQISKSGLDEKTKIYYYNNGLIKKIEHFRSHSMQEGYEMTSYYNIKIKSKIKVDAQIAKRINEQINI